MGSQGLGIFAVFREAKVISRSLLLPYATCGSSCHSPWVPLSQGLRDPAHPLCRDTAFSRSI